MTDPGEQDRESEMAALRDALVAELRRIGSMRMPRVADAFAAVPRHRFVPDVPPETAYENRSIQTKFVDGRSVSSASQPSIMAFMLEQLQVFPGQRVLEIGAGTGYNAALLAHLTGGQGRVTTIDIDQDIVDGARRNLAAAGVDGVEVVCADGGLGWPERALYDRIVVTAGSSDIPPAWREQLGLGGRLVMPLSIRSSVQKSVAFERRGAELTSVSIADCLFIPLRGAFGDQTTAVELDVGPNAQVMVENGALADPAALDRLLRGHWDAHSTGVRAAPGEIWAGLAAWLALGDPAFTSIRAPGPAAGGGQVPYTFGYGGPYAMGFTVGLLDGAGLAVLAPSEGESIFDGEALRVEPFELAVRSYGDAEAAAARLVEAVGAWDAAGRPANNRLFLRALPAGANPAGALVVRKRWSTLVGEYR